MHLDDKVNLFVEVSTGAFTCTSLKVVQAVLPSFTACGFVLIWHAPAVIMALLAVLFCRAIAVTQDGLAAKQRPIDEYNAGNTVAQQRKIAAELEQSREKRDAAARVS